MKKINPPANQPGNPPFAGTTGGITERLLQFIWQFRYFNQNELASTSGEPLQIIFQGTSNPNQGPDFLNARIRTGTTTWAGNVELHMKTGDWIKHRHQHDSNYQNVILHVVWENNQEVNEVPVLELKGRVPARLLKRYGELMNSATFIPCENNHRGMNELAWTKFKERLLAERLVRKARGIELLLKQSNYHWEETFWWVLAANFGLTVNTEAFEAIAKSIPLPVLAKHKHQVIQLEAILFGQAGLLEMDFTDPYPRLLQREYRFLREKYQLTPVHMPVHFLRMRPVNFPSIRLAQLAMLIKDSLHLFSKIREAGSAASLHQWFDVAANDYWHYHYRFDEETSFREKRIGRSMIANIIINTVCPVLFAYGMYHKENRYKEKALLLLEQTKAEINNITKGFDRLAIKSQHAFDSQALIELKNGYCNKKRCLDCAIGNSILGAS